MNKIVDYINVPVDLCLYSLKERKTSQVRLFLYFKSISNGFVSISSKTIKESAINLNVCQKTVRNHLKWLIKENWLSYYSISNSYHIIGFKTLANKLSFKTATGAIFYKNDISNYKAFAIAAVTTYQIKRIARRRKDAGLKRGSPSFQDLPPYPLYPHLSHTYLSKVLGLSKSNVANYRNLAIKYKYLKIEKQFKKTGQPNTQFFQLKKYCESHSHLLRRFRNKIFIQLPDKIESNIYLRSKKELISKVADNYNGKKLHHYKRVYCFK